MDEVDRQVGDEGGVVVPLGDLRGGGGPGEGVEPVVVEFADPGERGT
jgi:hypothetical protein